MGYTDAALTGGGADGGVDVVAREAVAQVKAEARPSGRPVVQQLAGVAWHENKQPLFFSLGGFSNEAVEWADDAEVALFSFDLTGEAVPANHIASRLLNVKSVGPPPDEPETAYQLLIPDLSPAGILARTNDLYSLGATALLFGGVIRGHLEKVMVAVDGKLDEYRAQKESLTNYVYVDYEAFQIAASFVALQETIPAGVQTELVAPFAFTLPLLSNDWGGELVQHAGDDRWSEYWRSILGQFMDFKYKRSVLFNMLTEWDKVSGTDFSADYVRLALDLACAACALNGKIDRYQHSAIQAYSEMLIEGLPFQVSIMVGDRFASATEAAPPSGGKRTDLLVDIPELPDAPHPNLTYERLREFLAEGSNCQMSIVGVTDDYKWAFDIDHLITEPDSHYWAMTVIAPDEEEARRLCARTTQAGEILGRTVTKTGSLHDGQSALDWVRAVLQDGGFGEGRSDDPLDLFKITVRGVLTAEGPDDDAVPARTRLTPELRQMAVGFDWDVPWEPVELPFNVDSAAAADLAARIKPAGTVAVGGINQDRSVDSATEWSERFEVGWAISHFSADLGGGYALQFISSESIMARLQPVTGLSFGLTDSGEWEATMPSGSLEGILSTLRSALHALGLSLDDFDIKTKEI